MKNRNGMFLAAAMAAVGAWARRKRSAAEREHDKINGDMVAIVV